MKDILCRLTESREWLSRDGFITSARNASDAADEIKQLRAENARQAERIAELEEEDTAIHDLKDKTIVQQGDQLYAQSAVIEQAKTAMDSAKETEGWDEVPYRLHVKLDALFDAINALPEVTEKKASE